MLELILAEKLVCTVFDEWAKVRYVLQENVSDVVHDGFLLLSARQSFRKAGVDLVDFLTVGEDRADELLAAVFRYRRSCGIPEWLHPEIAQVLQILHEVPL